nr:hypothetical protein A6C57_00260 [Fibrella sp. ES10-3-2-2]
MTKLTLALLLVSLSVQAQVRSPLPFWAPDPINQVIELTKANKQLTADLFSCDSLLDLTLADARTATTLKDQRITRLKNQADSLLRVENDKCKPLASAVATLLGGLYQLEQMETNEALMNRLFGSGRKRAARARRDYIIKLKSKATIDGNHKAIH